MFGRFQKPAEDAEIKDIKEEVTKEVESGSPQEDPERFREQLKQTIFGVRFPWEAVFFVTVGALSEVVDAMFLSTTLDALSPELATWQNILIFYQYFLQLLTALRFSQKYLKSIFPYLYLYFLLYHLQ